MREVVLALVIFLATSGTDGRDSPFGVYSGNSSWSEQVLFLDNLGHYLVTNPDMIGFLVYYSDSRVSKTTMYRRTLRGATYVKKTFKLKPGRVKTCYGGKLENAEVVIKLKTIGLPPC